MITSIKSLTWFLLFAFLSFLIHFYFIQRYCGPCGEVATSQTNELHGFSPFADFQISDTSGKNVFKFPSQFVINSKDGTVEIPAAMNSLRDSVFNYLNKNQDKQLLITGKYLPSETEFRGMDRANFLKDFLVKFGANPDKIIPKALLSEYSYNANQKYSQGIGMVFQNISDSNIKNIEQNIADKTLYADYATADFIPDNTLITYTNDLKNYLSKYTDKKITISGHTDDKGSDFANERLGLQRAKYVSNFLISQGIDKTIITTNSKGEKEPIADNATEEGCAQNRRITISVK
jgi:hypothetical protein